ncbi:unnamed protein product [Rotaria magnacalcarata]|uniref:RING-type domain-containing protein n=1 Tax=Rotaria magnacalcarata TaxID=392030 RepID=A0A816CPV1_9BILA|nr:unnamed protein product [Rotaria magnacalcarata]CAF1624596.1 unnamed protein product [Rotaria magnacalcarata]CAF2053406.1 unnamed protein product [Rotaria magnacalcarata]CAF2081050.1 unnamed protein product [Rotaria magnacalcarata]CAF4049974.1 unnamed protein product [Rotaria magnacalcarata]
MLSSFYTYENETEISSDVKCPICLDPFQLPLRDVYCGHTFCFQCIRTWLKRKQSCPICRQHFNKFVRINDERILKELDQIHVQCIYCNQTNIKRNSFNDHMSYECPNRTLIDHERAKQSTRDYLNIEYLLKRINESMDNSRIQDDYHEQINSMSLPVLIFIISGVHLLVYISVLIPVAIILNITDICFYLLRHAITLLTRLMKLFI